MADMGLIQIRDRSDIMSSLLGGEGVVKSMTIVPAQLNLNSSLDW